MNQKGQSPKNDLLLLVCLENNPSRTFREIYLVSIDKRKISDLLARDDVACLSDNAILFDSTTALDMYGQSCLILDQAKVPYMTVHIASASARVHGEFSKQVEATLKAYGIPLQKTS